MNGSELFPASYSRLSTYETCAAKAGFRYIQKIPSKKAPAAERGTNIHAGIESYLLKHTEEMAPEVHRIRFVMESVRKQEPVVEHKIALDETLRHTVDWKSKKAVFRMVLDSAYYDVPSETLEIQEWKSGKVWPDHGDQRRIYGVGALAEWECKQAVVTTYYLDQGTKLTLRVDPGHATILVPALQARLERMYNEKHFAPRPGNYCRWCDFSRYKGGPCRVG